MVSILRERLLIVFDLDDTLFKEIDFLRSAYRTISSLIENEVGRDLYSEMVNLYETGESTFDVIKKRYSVSMSVAEMVHIYRSHIPSIELVSGACELLHAIQKSNVPMGLITDGRSLTQRNKLKALGITDLFAHIVISEEFGSEKPTLANFQVFEARFPGSMFCYIADNSKKDFVAPNQLGWTTIQLKDDGRNIHKPNTDLPPHYNANRVADCMQDILLWFNNGQIGPRDLAETPKD